MCRKTCARRRKRPTPTTIRRANGAIGARGSGASGILSRHPKRETPHHSPQAEGSISEPFDKLRANGFWDYEFPFSVRAEPVEALLIPDQSGQPERSFTSFRMTE